MESPLHSEYVSYPSAAGEVRGYLAGLRDAAPGFPSPLAGEGGVRGRRPALIVIHEWIGLIPYIEDVCRRLAREGYLALAPDLYSGDPVRAELAVEDLEAATELGRAPSIEEGLQDVPPEQRAGVLRAHQWRQARTGDKYMPFLQGTLAYLWQRADVSPSAIGVIGFCMGGRLSATLATTGADLAAAIVFYGPIRRSRMCPRCAVRSRAITGARTPR